MSLYVTAIGKDRPEVLIMGLLCCYRRSKRPQSSIQKPLSTVLQRFPPGSEWLFFGRASFHARRFSGEITPVRERRYIRPHGALTRSLDHCCRRCNLRLDLTGDSSTCTLALQIPPIAERKQPDCWLCERPFRMA